MAGSIGYRQTVTLSANNSNVTVTLNHAFADTNYVITVEIPYQTSWWITNKANNQFVFNVGTINGYDQTIGFWIFHE